MKNLKDLTVTQVKIFPHDFIPYDYLFRPDVTDSIVKKYQFQKKDFPYPPYDESTPNVLLLHSGEIKIEKKKILIILLSFESRKITLKVKGSSKQAAKVFSQIEKDINESDSSNLFNNSNCLIETEETSCVVQLDINYESLFSNKTRRFLKQSIPEKVLPFNLKATNPIRLSFLIEFQQDKELFEKHRITISPKELTIEPRAGTSFDDKIFHTKSPTNSDTHLKLIREFEKAFKD